MDLFGLVRRKAMKWISLFLLCAMAGCNTTTVAVRTSTDNVWANSPTQKVEVEINSKF